MAAATSVVEVSNDVHDHGTLVNATRNRVECNYCSKEVAGFSRLKYHLGQVRGDVKPCQNVPEGVKILMRDSLLERKTYVFNREVTQLIPLDQPASKRSLSSCSYSSVTAKRKRKRPVVDSVPENGTQEMDLESWQEVLVSESASKNIKYEVDLSRPVKRNIARFFIENGIDSSAASSTSFKQMVDFIIARGGSIGFEIPSCDELSSLIQDEMKDIHHYVNEVRQSWPSTGCTIMLDGWTDEKGCSLINFLVDCPKGPIFLKSADITDALGDVNAMISLLDQVIKDVGVENVVQVMTYTKSNFMDKVGTKLMDKYRTIFWSVCASHCITLMLQKIGMMKTMRRVWSKANTITKFIYSDDTLLRLVRKHTHGRDLIMSSGIKQAILIPFLTLENIVSKNEKGNMKTFFNSSTWKTSNWAHTAKGREVSSLVKDPTFWAEASLVMKATIPLVCYMLLINGEDGKVPYIYETMDQVKEKIKHEIRNKNKYMPIWDAIDEIWDNILHSPLHSAGYFLNPSLSYSSDFASDSEVASGLLSCIVRMVEVHKTQDRLTQQIEMYQRTMGTFGEEVAKDDSKTLPPVKWWSLYGRQCPELQKFAIRILSQTCCGASGYNLRSSSEQLRKCVEHKRLNDLMFVEHNARLQHSLSVNNNTNNTNTNFVLEHTKEMSDFFMVVKQELNSGCWGGSDLVMVAEQELIYSGRDGSDLAMVGEQELNIERDDFAWSDTDEAIILRGVVSSFELQDEPPFGLVMDN